MGAAARHHRARSRTTRHEEAPPRSDSDPEPCRPRCLGPDHLYGGLKNWNAELSEEDWVNEVLFLGLCIVPVYPMPCSATS